MAGPRVFYRRGDREKGAPVNLVWACCFNRGGAGRKEVWLIWRGPAVLTGGAREKEGRIMWRGPTILTEGGSGERGRVLTRPRRFKRRGSGERGSVHSTWEGVGRKEVHSIWRGPAFLTSGGWEERGSGLIWRAGPAILTGGGAGELGIRQIVWVRRSC